MEWMGVASALLGGLGGLFGGGNSGPTYQEQMYGQYSQILDEAMRIYRTTDLATTDKNSLADYTKNVNKQVDQSMSNYDARLASAGYTPEFSDTEKTRTMGRFAKEGADAVATMGADLDRTRSARQAALLPNTGAVAGGFDMASRLDSFRNNQQANEYQALMQVANGLVPLLFRKGKGKSKNGYTNGSDASTEFDLPQVRQL